MHIITDNSVGENCLHLRIIASFFHLFEARNDNYFSILRLSQRILRFYFEIAIPVALWLVYADLTLCVSGWEPRLTASYRPVRLLSSAGWSRSLRASFRCHVQLLSLMPVVQSLKKERCVSWLHFLSPLSHRFGPEKSQWLLVFNIWHDFRQPKSQ